VQKPLHDGTPGAANVHAIEVDGDFDACQAIVKALFADRELLAAQARSVRRELDQLGRGSSRSRCISMIAAQYAVRFTARWTSSCRPAISATRISGWVAKTDAARRSAA
jgi:hypothetical protein